MTMSFRIWRFIAIVSNILLAVSCVSTTKDVPLWMYDCNSVFSNKTYIVGVGNGKRKEVAKNNSVAELGRYLNTRVESVIESGFVSESDAESHKTMQKVSQTVTVSSNVALSGISYTECYFNNNEGLFYCCAYITREKLWQAYLPEIEQARTQFYSIYEAVRKEDPITALQHYIRIKEAADYYLEKLAFANVIDSEKEKRLYLQDRKTIANLPAYEISLRNNITINIYVKNDEYGFLVSELAKDFSALGFSVMNKESANYIAKAELIFNENCLEDSGDFIWTEEPVLMLQFFYKSKTVCQCYFKEEEKIISFYKDDARRKATKKIVEKIKNEFKKDFSAKFAD